MNQVPKLRDRGTMSLARVTGHMLFLVPYQMTRLDKILGVAIVMKQPNTTMFRR